MYKSVFSILEVCQGCYMIRGVKIFFIKGKDYCLISWDKITGESEPLDIPYYGINVWGNYIHKRKNIFFDTLSNDKFTVDEIILNENEDVALLASDKNRLLYTVVNDKEDTFSFRLLLNRENIDLGMQVSSPSMLCGDRIISSTLKNINCYKYNTKISEVWQHSFTNLLQHDRAILHSEIIEHKGKLYFFLDGSPNNRTFCVDIETGEVIHQYPDLQGWLVRDNDFLYVTNSNVIVRLNTQIGTIEKWDVKDLLVSAGLGDHMDYHRYAVQDGWVFFTQSMGVEHTTVGILDFNIRALLWYYKFENDMVGAIGSIQVHGNRLYVHTQDNTLHVFEREASL